MNSLKGCRALVTGASSGIGKEFSNQLAALGCNLVIAARRIDRLETLASQIRSQYSVEVDCIQIDLTQPHAAKDLFEKSTHKGKKINLLINNAGVGNYGYFIETPLENHLRTIHLNATVVTELTYLFVQHMLEHGQKSYITQVASIAAYQPVANFSIYSATKGYVRYFSETLQFELKNSPIHIMCLCPGGTYTEFFEHSGQKITSSGHYTMMSVESVVKIAIRDLLKLKSISIPGVLNKLACFLPRFLPSKLSLHLAFKAIGRAVEKL